ncbi:hypothetical protein Syun_011939 [Stephania yunnanensis]|uniref:Uncharacterized protein n=1 Tax=Stephania yunnanensis TaxID=152371 RepID=A0AAP0PH08_9MAGN
MTTSTAMWTTKMYCLFSPSFDIPRVRLTIRGRRPRLGRLENPDLHWFAEVAMDFTHLHSIWRLGCYSLAVLIRLAEIVSMVLWFCVELAVVSADLSIVDLDVPFNLAFSVAAMMNTYANLEVVRVQNLPRRGIGVHHAGLLPIIKEVVEMFFCRGVIKERLPGHSAKELRCGSKRQSSRHIMSPDTDYHILSLREEKSALETVKFNLRWKRVFISVSVWVAFLLL